MTNPKTTNRAPVVDAKASTEYAAGIPGQTTWLLVSALLWLSSCAYAPFQYQDEALLPYVQAYEQACSRDTSHIMVYFRELTEETAGTCYNAGIGRWIEIDPDLWLVSTELEREMLMFHEMGHCDLSREHTTLYKDGCPVSMMHPYLFGAHWCYRERRQTYHKELCTASEASVD